MIKPYRAEDWVREKQRFPVLAMPKIDGVRGLHLDDVGLLGRSGKPHPNKRITELFSLPHFRGIDGELIAQRPTHPDLCRLTTSAVRLAGSTAPVRWQVFDFINAEAIALCVPYIHRYDQLSQHIEWIKASGARGSHLIDLVPFIQCEDIDHLDKVHDHNVQAGFEGTILRDPMGLYKQGRSTVNEGGYLRIKDFVYETAIVIGVTEGRKNNNAATDDRYGHTERATLAENMEPNGMIGSLLVRFVREVVYNDKVVFNTRDIYTVAAGKMDHATRKRLFENQSEIIGQYVEAQVFLHGTKDKPRFPTFQRIRAKSDVDADR